MNITRHLRTAPVVVAVVTAVALTGCSDGGSSHEAGGRGGRGTTPASRSSTTSSSTTSTTAAPTTTTTTAPVPRVPNGLTTGSKGPEVQALEQRLIDLRFDPGKVDGVYDSSTMHAVMAFQKLNGMARTGRATSDVIDRLAGAHVPGALVPGGGSMRVEVDLPRQVLLLWKDNQVFRIIDVSTGSGKRYCVDGECAKAVTPGGSFRVSRRISGWRTSRLGRLYNPLYFNGGIAIHGAPSVPGYPASHGCVRIPMYASAWFPQVVPNGTPVYVVGGPKAPVPFGEQAPPDAVGGPTTTTVPATASTTAPPPATTAPPTTRPTTSTTLLPTTSTTSTTAPTGTP